MSLSPRLSLRMLLVAIAVGFCLTSGRAGDDTFVNFETGPVRPLALSPSGDHLYAANIPDSRVQIFAVSEAGLTPVGEVRVGLEPCALAARTDTELWVVNHLSDSVSVVDVSDPSRPLVRQTLPVGDEPRDIVVAGEHRERVFVTAARRGQNRPGDPQLTTPGVGRADVWVFDAQDLAAPPHILTLFTDTPRGLAATADGTRVYVAGFHTGNQTTVIDDVAASDDPGANALIGDGFQGLGLPPVPPQLDDSAADSAPATGVILRYDGEDWVDSAGRDWSPRVRLSLPDKDLFALDATSDPPEEIGHAAGVGTILFNVAVHPVDGKVYVSNLESRNHVRFEPALKGHIAENRVSIVDFDEVAPGEDLIGGVDAVHLNPHIDYSVPSGPASERAQSIAAPLDLVFDPTGERLYVASFGTGEVAVLDAQATVLEKITVGGGPCGLALDVARGRLYVLNRFDLSLSTVDLASSAEIARTPLAFNPEPPRVREGRPVLYNADRSGHGDASCASCHIFGDFDSLAWDLGDPGGEIESNPIPRVSVQGGSRLGSFHPMKGPMTTQSLRGMKDAGAMHWRGDRNGGEEAPFDEEAAFMAFRPAFEGLLGMGEPLPMEEMELFRDFILTVVYPPNPNAPLDGSLNEAQARGKAVFDSDGSRTGVGGDGDACADCHTMPLGTDGRGSFEILPQDFKVAHLRNLYQKVGMFGSPLPSIVQFPGTLESTPTPSTGDQVRGFGFLHDGSVPTLFDFFRFPFMQFTFLDRPGSSGLDRIRDLEAFLLAFPTGLAPAVGQQVTFSASGGDTERLEVLEGRAAAGDCDLMVSGAIGGEQRSYLRDGSRAYRPSRTADPLSREELLALLVEGGDALTFTATPPGAGERMALDRDEDGWLDGDEAASFGDPNDASVVPRPAPPAGLVADVVAAAVELSWEAVTSNLFEIEGYHVYRSSNADDVGERVNDELVVATSYTDEAVAAGTYVYSVMAVGNEGQESDASPAVEVVVSEGASTFLRSDCNGDGILDIGDPVASLFVQFTGLSVDCVEACDSSGDGIHDVSDPIHGLTFLFLGGPPPGDFPDCEVSTGDCQQATCPNGK